jgi:hypothetical protein
MQCGKYHVVAVGRDNEGRIVYKILHPYVSGCCAEAKVIILKAKQPNGDYRAVPVVCGSYAV